MGEVQRRRAVVGVVLAVGRVARGMRWSVVMADVVGAAVLGVSVDGAVVVVVDDCDTQRQRRLRQPPLRRWRRAGGDRHRGSRMERADRPVVAVGVGVVAVRVVYVHEEVAGRMVAIEGKVPELGR